MSRLLYEKLVSYNDHLMIPFVLVPLMDNPSISTTCFRAQGTKVNFTSQRIGAAYIPAVLIAF